MPGLPRMKQAGCSGLFLGSGGSKRRLKLLMPFG
jgi:hypothetical protein